MMAEPVSINFSRPIPLFPLPVRDAILLPHAVQPLHIFESHYRRMVEDVLDGPGLIAMASYAYDDEYAECDDEHAIRPVVCVGRIVDHQRFPDGRYNIIVQGVCRARVESECERDPDRPYHCAVLTPIESDELTDDDLVDVRHQLERNLRRPRLQRVSAVRLVREWCEQEEIPTPALLEMLAFLLVNQPELKYALLAEPDVHIRADMLDSELSDLDHILAAADRQSYRKWPKGQAWN